jgi:formate C-acetyltransferase
MDAVNPLSYAILESCGRLRSTSRTSACATTRDEQRLPRRLRAGDPLRLRDAAFNNDEIVIPEFIKLGVEPQDAYDYAAIGCIETAVGGKWGYRCTGMSFINFARVMLAALEGGRDATSGKVFLPQEKALSAGNFDNFDEVMADWDTRSATTPANPSRLSTWSTPCWKRTSTIFSARRWWTTASNARKASSRAARSMTGFRPAGGHRQPRQQPGGGEEAGVRTGRYRSAAAGGGAGGRFRRPDPRAAAPALINGAPKYGNDDDSVDMLLARAYQTYIDELKQYHNPRYGRGPIGGNYYAGTSSISANVPFGAQTMATPDGRKAHTPLAEGASPASGTDHLGPTAVIGSVGKLPTGAILGGVLLNQKLNPSTLENESISRS